MQPRKELSIHSIQFSNCTNMGKFNNANNKRLADSQSAHSRKNNVIGNNNKKLIGLSRGQRKRLAKKNNLIAKKTFVKVLTTLDKKDKKSKKFGKLQVDDVSKMFEEVAKQIANKDKGHSMKNNNNSNRKNNSMEIDNNGKQTTTGGNNIRKNTTTTINIFGSNTKNVVSKKNKKSRKIIREELSLFNAVNKHPGFQSMGGLNAIQQHLKNIVQQHGKQ